MIWVVWALAVISGGALVALFWSMIADSRKLGRFMESVQQQALTDPQGAGARLSHWLATGEIT